MAGGFESLGLSEELIRAIEGDLNWLLPTVCMYYVSIDPIHLYTSLFLLFYETEIMHARTRRTCKMRASRSSWAAAT